jgi:hypothetical protein
MTLSFDRRHFLKAFSAACSMLGLQAAGQSATQAPDTAPHTMDHAVWVGGHPTRIRPNVVAIQTKPFCWNDEGIENVLDNLQNKGAVNTIYSYTYDTDPNRIHKGGQLPGHGKFGPDGLRTGGGYFDYDPKYFLNTRIKEFRSFDDGKFNVITDVAPKAKARGMDYFALDFNNPFPVMMKTIPGYSEVSEIDINGLRTATPCYNNPDYRAFLQGKIEVYLKQYAEYVDGIMWSAENMGPFDNMIGGDWAMIGISCFCPYCLQKARDKGISSERAKEGYRRLQYLFRSGSKLGQRPPDGYFATFWRTLLEYPEVLSWNNLWMDSYREVRAELYGAAKSIAPEKPFGFHIQQNVTFSPFYSGAEDFAQLANFSDFLKIATYNNAGGPRMARLIDRLADTVFRDTDSAKFLPVYYDMMGYHQASEPEITLNGLTSEYVISATRRIMADVGDKSKIYPGIDIGVPTKAVGEKQTHADDVRQAVTAAWQAGVPGIVLSRDYSEMELESLAAAGDATRAFLHKQS